MPTAQELLAQAWKLHQAGDIQLAIDVYKHVLSHAPRNADAMVFLGIAFFDQRRFAQSEQCYRDAISLQPHFPVAWNNLGNSLRMQGKIEEAEQALAMALSQQPGYLSALKNRGTLWVWAGEVERGLQWYSEGLKIDPQNAELHRNLGVIHLLLGNDSVGWNEYRWRWGMPGTYRPPAIAPVWQGEELAGRSILIYPEQGRGDAIQFVRVASVLKKAGAAAVYVQCAEEMMPLFSSVPGIDLLLPSGSAIPPIDFQGSFLDVVDFWYQSRRELPYESDLISPGAGYLHVDDRKVSEWRAWLNERIPNGMRIGINWQGNPEHHADVYRSFPLEVLRPLLKIPNSTLVSLQFGFGSYQLESCSFTDSIVKLSPSLDRNGGAFADTAAILKNLDYVVTSDTAIAHLAGALGIKVIVMLGKIPDWRWRTEGDQTAWYPTMTLVRQSKLGEWGDVVDRLVKSI